PLLPERDGLPAGTDDPATRATGRRDPCRQPFAEEGYGRLTTGPRVGTIGISLVPKTLSSRSSLGAGPARRASLTVNDLVVRRPSGTSLVTGWSGWWIGMNTWPGKIASPIRARISTEPCADEIRTRSPGPMPAFSASPRLIWTAASPHIAI